MTHLHIRTFGSVIAAALVAGLLLPAPPAYALFHLMKVTEVFAGTTDQPAAQFVELQMYANDQRFIATHEVVIFDGSGTETGTFTFTSALQNGASQSYVLVATPEAEALFGVPADLEMTPEIVSGGGKACFRGNDGALIDCASWGTYTGDDAGSGTAFNQPIGLVGDQSMTRITSGGSDPSRLDEEDDTDDSAADFRSAPPSPTNNAGDTAGVVTHDRSVTLNITGARRMVTSGQVTAEDDFEACFSEVPVRLQRKGSTRWTTVTATTTDPSGNYRVATKDRTGTYRAIAPELDPTEEHRCSKAVSPARRRR